MNEEVHQWSWGENLLSFLADCMVDWKGDRFWCAWPACMCSLLCCCCQLWASVSVPITFLMGCWEYGRRQPGECCVVYNSLKVCPKDVISCLGWEVVGWGWSVLPRTQRELPICHIGRTLRAQIQMENPTLEVTHSRTHTSKTFELWKNNSSARGILGYALYKMVVSTLIFILTVISNGHLKQHWAFNTSPGSPR